MSRAFPIGTRAVVVTNGWHGIVGTIVAYDRTRERFLTMRPDDPTRPVLCFRPDEIERIVPTSHTDEVAR